MSVPPPVPGMTPPTTTSSSTSSSGTSTSTDTTSTATATSTTTPTSTTTTTPSTGAVPDAASGVNPQNSEALGNFMAQMLNMVSTGQNVR